MSTSAKSVSSEKSDKPVKLSEQNKKLLHFAVNGYRDGIVRVLKEGADINARDNSLRNEGETALMKAVQNNDLATTRLLIERKANIDATDARGETALLLAAYLGHNEMTRLLVEKGANVNIVNKLGISPLFIASDRGRIEIVQYLLKHGGRAEPLKSGYNVLMATSKNAPQILEIFLELGMNPNTENTREVTPLMEAACANNVETMKLLIQFGADLNHKNKKGKGVLEYLYLCEGMYNHGFTYKQKIFRLIMEKNPSMMKELYSSNVFHRIIGEANNINKNSDLVPIKQIIDLTDLRLLNSVDSAGYTVLDKFYLYYGVKENWLFTYLEKRGAKAPQKQLIAELNLIKKQMSVQPSKEPTAKLVKHFQELMQKFGKTDTMRSIYRIYPRSVFFALLTKANVFPESFYSDSNYVFNLCRNGHEDKLLEYYDKNYSLSQVNEKRLIDTDDDGLFVDFRYFAANIFIYCSTRATKKMVERNEPVLYSAYPSIMLMQGQNVSKGQIITKIEKFKLVLKQAATKPDAEIWSVLPLKIIQRSYNIRWLLMLLEYPLNLQVTDNRGNNLVHFLLQKGNKKFYSPLTQSELKVLNLVITKATNVNAQNNDGDTALMLAARRGYHSLVKLLISRGANIGHKNQLFEDALFAAKLNRHTSITELLLSKGAKADRLEFFNDLHTEQKLSSFLLKKYRLRYSESLRKYVGLYGYTLNFGPTEFMMLNRSINDCSAYRAVQSKDLVLLQRLLEYGYSPNCLQVVSNKAYSYIQGTPLGIALNRKNVEAVKLLFEYGADPEYVNKWGKTYLDYNRDKESMQLLKEAIEKKKQESKNVP
ncbi:MAG: ankyrin repeat domain-containing protein [Leptospirales bacterium]